jgi:serine/threonine-protein kinase HipA
MTHTDDSLEVFLHGEPVGMLTKGKKHGTATFKYHSHAPYALSVSMPVRELPYDPVATYNWFTGLLPEGDQLNFIARHFVVSLTDYVDILRETGLDCAGAVTFGAPHPALPYDTSSAVDLNDIAPVLPKVLAGTRDDSLRSVISGFQPKTTALRSSKWTGPDLHSLTTHIAKTEPKEFVGMADAEAWAMTLVSRATKTANVRVEEFSGIRTIIVDRFDRLPYDGEIYAIHQEDFCQALGLPVARKYAEPGTNLKTSPSLKKLAAMLKERSLDPDRELAELVRHMAANVVVGNLDWHAKNVGLIHDTTGMISLAPLYDVVPAKHFLPDKFQMSMSVNYKFRIDRIGFSDLVAEATLWGMDSKLADSLVRDALAAIALNIDAAETEYPMRPEGVFHLVSSQLNRMTDEMKETP